MVGRLQWSESLFGYTIGSPDGDLSFDTRDSAPFVPKCKILDPAFTWGDQQTVRVPWDSTVIYEAHLRGLSMRHPAVPEERRGTFAGLTNPELLRHIRSLGITSWNCSRCTPSSTISTCWTRTSTTTGLQQHRLLRPAPGLPGQW